MPWWGSKEEEETHSGQVGDLSEHQAQVLADFKKIIQDESITNDPRYDDYYLLRFCRARKFELDKVVEMFTKFIQWRKDNNVDRAMVEYKCPNMPEVKKMYQHGYHGTDREGRPFYIDRPCQFLIDDVFAIADKEELIHYFIREYEKFIHLRLAAASNAAGHRIDRSLSLMDIKGFSMSHLKESAREFLKIPMTITQNNYPETMHKLYVVNAPFVFKGAWSMLKGFISEGTRKKIFILGSSFQTDLFKDVDPDNVPKSLGGNCDCSEYADTSKVEPDQDGLYCFAVERGPWDDHLGDKFAEAAKEELRKEVDGEEVKEMSHEAAQLDVIHEVIDLQYEESQKLSKDNSHTVTQKHVKDIDYQESQAKFGKDQKPAFAKFTSKQLSDDENDSSDAEPGVIKLDLYDF